MAPHPQTDETEKPFLLAFRLMDSIQKANAEEATAGEATAGEGCGWAWGGGGGACILERLCYRESKPPNRFTSAFY